MAGGLGSLSMWASPCLSLPGLVWASLWHGGVSKAWSPKRDQEADGSHNVLYHLALGVLQGHFCYLLFVEAVVKFKGVQGEEKESLYADGEWQR